MIDTHRERRLEQVIADYLAAEDAGAAPDRAELRAAHPELAEDLRAFFREHDRIGRLASPFRAAQAGPEESLPLPAEEPTAGLATRPSEPRPESTMAGEAATNDPSVSGGP